MNLWPQLQHLQVQVQDGAPGAHGPLPLGRPVGQRERDGGKGGWQAAGHPHWLTITAPGGGSQEATSEVWGGGSGVTERNRCEARLGNGGVGEDIDGGRVQAS